MNKTEAEIKYNKSTRFLLPSLRLNEEILLKMGFKNVYLSDHQYDVRWDFENCLYLLFRPKVMNEEFEAYCSSMRLLPSYKDEYDVDGGVMFVLQVPPRFQHILKPFKRGKYSEIDKNYVKECIPQFINGAVSKRWKVFYKDKSLVEELAEELGYKSMEIALKWIDEVEDKPYFEDEIFRANLNLDSELPKKGQLL